ncbi:Sensor protein VraS [Novipirellula aureliae]|uniref:histidine kinase n=1 Tax=Novipirellula aureliae TaxID=2527966 RepID=A0A5C6E4Q1_9BACT|nr:ATP-binding protein [Novipirellula aureliae]TWU43820.1 Sensor protein VraS [Novipirellula aureliae]
MTKKVGSVKPMDEDRLTELIESERSAIGHEIHDSMLPLLFGASAVLHREIERANSDQTDIERLEKATAWVDEAMRIGRNILSLAHAPKFDSAQDTASWDAEVESTVEGVLDVGEDLPWTLKMDVSEKAKIVSAPVATAAYRISVEAVRNAIRHGKATEVQITASVENSTLHLSVHDNGNGFDVNAIPDDRYGIRTMKGRAKLVGGTLRVESRCSGPTIVHFDCHVNGS